MKTFCSTYTDVMLSQIYIHMLMTSNELGQRLNFSSYCVVFCLERGDRAQLQYWFFSWFFFRIIFYPKPFRRITFFTLISVFICVLIKSFHTFHFYLWKHFMQPSTLSLGTCIVCIKNNKKPTGVHSKITGSLSNFIVFGKRVIAESTFTEAD